MAFIMIGNLNALAPIVTMPFLLTYASIDYAYFKLAMSYDMRQKQKMAEHVTQEAGRTKGSSLRSKLVAVELGGNGKYGAASAEKHDFGTVIFSPDETEKDDSKEKENIDKDNVLEKTSLSHGDNKTQLDTTKKASFDHEGTFKPNTYDTSDTTILLEKDKVASETIKKGE